jgi:soluble lytic murein transglycosylase-like protein
MRIYAFFALSLLVSQTAQAHPLDLELIKMIESSGKLTKEVGPAGERGLYQITPGVWKDYNAAKKRKPGPLESLFDPATARKVADWYLDWLYYRCQTPQDTIIAWNRGIGNWRKWKARGSNYDELPQVTKDYLKKYFKS